MYSSRNSALWLWRRACDAFSGVVVRAGSPESAVSKRKGKTCSSRRIQRRARETRCGVDANWTAVGVGRYREMRLDPTSRIG